MKLRYHSVRYSTFVDCFDLVVHCLMLISTFIYLLYRIFYCE